MPSAKSKNHFQPYPDLSPVLAELTERKTEQTPEKEALFDKWIAQLNAVNSEMRKLEKIELFTRAVTSDASDE